jgi:hypothetical protein
MRIPAALSIWAAGTFRAAALHAHKHIFAAANDHCERPTYWPVDASFARPKQ